ncbi:MAG: hypothetical protein ABFR95_01595 [Actinomycetota bacterium]
MIKTAYFRTYLPASRSGALPPRRDVTGASKVSHDGKFLWTESMVDDAIFTVWQGEQYACPRNMRLRMIEGVLAFSKTYPMMPMVSDAERVELASELAVLRKATPISRSFILSSAWHVPLRWFSAFAPSERELYESDAGSSIRYRTSIGEAIDRVHWSATVLSNSGFPEQVIERVDDLERWLMEFSADSMVELDYDQVARVFSDADLALDESVEDIRNSLLALERGDGDESQRHYEQVASRWFRAQSFTFSN